MADDEKVDLKNNNTNNDYISMHIPVAYSLRQTQFKIVHISNHDNYSPTDEYLNESLQLTNNEYTLQTLKDRSNLADNLFENCDTILLSVWSKINEEMLGELVANAVDKGTNVVILLFSNTLSYKHPQGRFMKETYNATTRVHCQSVDGTLGWIYQPNHPIMNNVKAITLGSEKRRSMGKIAETEQHNIDRIADWNDGNVLIAIRHNKPGLITEITCSFGINGAQSDGKQLMNNALRLTQNNFEKRKLKIPMCLLNVISNSNFHVLQQIQSTFKSKHMRILQNNRAQFQGWDNVYNDISNQVANILNSIFNGVWKQIEKGTQQEIDALTVKKSKCLEEVENIKKRFEAMGLPDVTIQQSVAPLLEHAKILQTEIDEWKKLQTDGNQLIASKK